VDFEALWADSEVRRNLIATLILLAAVVAARFTLLRAARRLTASSRAQLRLSWMNTVRRSAIALLILGVIVIWSSELQTFALSIVAFAVAIVLAVKELLLCMSGSLLRTSAKMFSIGDRIEVNALRGDVVDHGLLATSILEIGPGHRRTGRKVVLPNSIFLSAHVVNETATQQYVLHTINVPLAPGSDWEAAERILLDVANETCAAYVDPAKRHLEALSSQHGLVIRSVEPRVAIGLPAADEVMLHLRVPTKARDKGVVEQTILRKFLSLSASASA